MGAKWQKRKELTFQSLLLLKPDVGPYVKAKLRQKKQLLVDSASRGIRAELHLYSVCSSIGLYWTKTKSIEKHLVRLQNVSQLQVVQVVTSIEVLIWQVGRGSALCVGGCAYV